MDNKKAVRPRGTDSARVIQVIETRSLMGGGEQRDPVREIKQFWDFDGHLIAESDPFIDEEYEELSQQFSRTE